MIFSEKKKEDLKTKNNKGSQVISRAEEKYF